MGRAEHSADRSPRRCTLLSFQRPLRSLRRDSPLSTLGAAHGNPRRTKEYSAWPAVCLGGGPKAAEAPLPGLQLASGKAIDLEVEGLRGHRLAVELDPSLLDQAPALAAADSE